MNRTPSAATLAAAILTAALALASSPAKAQTQDNPFGNWYLEEAPAGWHFDAFAGIEREPTYAGSDLYETEPDVGFRAFYRGSAGRRYMLSLGELGYFQKFGENYGFGAVLEVEEGRDDEDDPTLTGFDVVDETVELQLSLARRWGNAYFGAVAQPDLLDRGKGFVFFLGGGYDRTVVSGRFRFSAKADVSWGNAEHMQAEFGVTAEESVRTGLAPYAPETALKSATAGLQAEWTFAPRWSLLGGAELEYYFDEAADSPLISVEGSETTVEAGLAVRFRFGRFSRE